MQSIDNFNFAGKKAFVRVDFNVPLDENFNITDDTRIRAALPTLKKILADGGSVIIGSHLGRPKGVTDKYSLKHILKHVSELLGVDVQSANDCIGEEAGAKKASREVWLKMQQTKKRKLPRKLLKKVRKNLQRDWHLMLTAM